MKANSPSGRKRAKPPGRERTNLGAATTGGADARSSVSIIAVCYNERPYIEPCLSRLLAQSYSPREVILVDNASDDGSTEYAKRQYGDKVAVIANDRNSGYMGAVNIGIQHATGDYVAVLNLDTEPDEHCLAPLVAFLDEHPSVGAVTSKVLLADHRDTINALGLDIHVTGLGFNRGLGARNFPESASPFPVAGVHGSCFLIRRHLLAHIAPIVGDCFLYHDDVQISWLIHLMGYQVYCVPDSIIYHRYALHMFPAKFFFLERNRWEMLAYSLEFHSLLQYLPMMATTELLTAGYSLLKGPRYAWAKLRAYVAIWRRRGAIRQKRATVQALRVTPDSRFLPRFRKGYPWQQVRTIVRSTRRAQLWAVPGARG